MFSTSSAFQTAVKQNTRDWKTQIVMETGQGQVTFTEAEIGQSSLKWKEASTDGTYFNFGSARCGEIEFFVQDYSGAYDAYQFNGAVCRPRVGLLLPNSTYEWVPLGVFYIDVPERQSDGFKLHGWDALILAERPFSEVPVTFPIGPINLLTQVCAFCNIPVNGSSLTTTFPRHKPKQHKPRASCHERRPSGAIFCKISLDL